MTPRPLSFEIVQCSGFVIATDSQDENIRLHLKNSGAWEPTATKVVQERFSGGTFVDVGAHWGYYSMLLAQQVDRVFAFEPNPRTFKCLVESIRLNGFTNVVPIQMACWDKKTRISTGEPGSNTGGTKSEENASGDFWGERLDRLFKPNEIQFMKIDAEGTDSRVLDGARAILTEGNPLILVESPPNWLSGLGYKNLWSDNIGGPTSLWSK